MNAGVYGTVRAANMVPREDAEMFYYYRPTRGTESSDFADGFKRLDVESCLVKSDCETDYGTEALIGMYDLRLPLDKFNLKGIYTVYIRPREYTVRISDVGVLASFPDIRGIVINTGDHPELSGIDLTGYRVEYFDSNGERNSNITRIITSCNYAEPVLVTVTGSYPKVTRWNIVSDNSSSYVFCTVTPSTSNSFSPNAQPFIGTAGDDVILINTKFDPLMVEVEMVDNDMTTIATMLEGDQVRDRDHGLLTYYDENKAIYEQYELYTLKDSRNNPLYDVRKKKDVPDTTQAWENIVVPND